MGKVSDNSSYMIEGTHRFSERNNEHTILSRMLSVHVSVYDVSICQSYQNKTNVCIPNSA